MKLTKAFTLIELIFVIVILGVLAAVALPRFAGIRVQADTANGIANIATIQAALVNERQRRLILGNPAWITVGSGAGAINNGGLFNGVLTTPLTNSDTPGNWNTLDTNNGLYNYNIDGTNTVFTYEDVNGTFTCVTGANDCDALSD